MFEKKHKSWMTIEILDLMDKRRHLKNKDINKYKQLHNIIKDKGGNKKRKIDKKERAEK